MKWCKITWELLLVHFSSDRYLTEIADHKWFILLINRQFTWLWWDHFPSIPSCLEYFLVLGQLSLQVSWIFYTLYVNIVCNLLFQNFWNTCRMKLISVWLTTHSMSSYPSEQREQGIQGKLHSLCLLFFWLTTFQDFMQMLSSRSLFLFWCNSLLQEERKKKLLKFALLLRDRQRLHLMWSLSLIENLMWSLSLIESLQIAGFTTRACLCWFHSLQPGASLGDYEFPRLK